MSANGTSVWTGRAWQAESDDLEVIGLALLYPALEGTFVFLAIIIRAHPTSFSERPIEAGRATRSRMGRRARLRVVADGELPTFKIIRTVCARRASLVAARHDHVDVRMMGERGTPGRKGRRCGRRDARGSAAMVIMVSAETLNRRS
jgi:hypothetical protein